MAGQWDDFDHFVSARWSAVVRFAYRITLDVDAAEDLSQEAFARAWGRWSSIDPSKAEAYVRRTVTNAYISGQRRRATFEKVKRLLVGGDVEHPADVMAERDSVKRSLARLTANQRIAVTLRFIEDLPVDEVAELTGWSTGTVKTHTARALGNLRNQLSLDEAESPIQGERHGHH